MKRLEKLRPGQTPTRDQYNDLVARVTALSKVNGRNGITARVTNNGVSLTATGINELKKRLPRASFVRTTPGATSAVECFLDTDSSSGVTPGDRITVFCELIGVGATSGLNAVIPRLEDGVLLPAWLDTRTSAWRAFMPFQGSEDCD